MGVNANLEAFLYREGSKTVSSLIGIFARRRSKSEPEEIARDSAREKAAAQASHFEKQKPSATATIIEPKIEAAPPVLAPTVVENEHPGNIQLPTREETHAVLKRRLARELYKAELDLESRLLINGKPCDCLSDKHTLGFEAMIEELLPYEPHNQVYPDITRWIKENGQKVTVEAISTGKYSDEYPVMADQFKDFRKRVMGTSAARDTGADMKAKVPEVTLEEAKHIAAQEAMRVIETGWDKKELDKVQ